MRILLLSPLPPPFGGMARWTEDYQNYLGYNNSITVVDSSLEHSKRKGFFCYMIHQIRRTIRIIKALSSKIKNKIDIVHINSSCTSFGIIRDYYCAKIVYKKSIPLVFHCHCNVSDQLGKGKLSNLFFSKTLHLASRVYILNKSSEDFCRMIVPDLIRRCPNSIDESLITRKHFISENIKTAVFVGHLYKSKGIESIIATAKKYPSISFRIIGPYNSTYNETCNTKNLLFLGSKTKDEVLSELDKADLFLFPSHTEGFSIALLEAMARGVPVISTNVGANMEMLENQGGIVIDSISDNALDFSSIMDYRIRTAMSEWSVKKVKKNYTHGVVFGMIEEDYRKIIGSYL